MGRTYTRSGQGNGSAHLDQGRLNASHSSMGSLWDHLLVRLIFGTACVLAGYHFRPFGMQSWSAAILGGGFALAVFLFEMRLQRVSLRRLIGAATGSILGILGAHVMGLALARTSIPDGSRSFLDVALLLVMTYIGLVLGATKGDMLNLHALGGLFGSERGNHRQPKVLDTSVIIDGRIVDICEAFFLEGALLVPQFVLRELQMVADSADGLKRQRGRRGLEVLQRIQKMPHVEVNIVDDDFPQIPEVDLKLIELAKRHDAKIVTNDYNLNKVATLQGLEVLNINQLANALKPVVLPGEAMRVFILREGKEHNQGVAYLDDGTMVVVDGGRRAINKTVEISVTSVHQTTAGKMIFGRLDDRAESPRHGAAQGVEPATRAPGETLHGMPRTIIPEPSES